MVGSSLLTRGASATWQHGPCPAELPFLLHLSSAWASLVPLMGRRQLRDPHGGTLLRHLHSDSETHFYLFTVNAYRCSQQPQALLAASCWLLTRVSGQTTKELPQSPPVLLPLSRLGITLGYHQELIRSETRASAEAEASTL